MRTWAKGSAFLAASVVVMGGGVAGATAHADTDGQSSVGGGNQVNLPVSAPIDISGNSVAGFGRSRAGSVGGASVDNGRRGGTGSTSGRSSVGGGNQITAPISAPINACGNAVSLFGNADAGCKGGATVRNNGGVGGRGTTSGKSSVLGGNQVTAPISAPINVCGNAVAIFGQAVAGCKGGASVDNGGGRGAGHTSGQSSVGGGNQVFAPIAAPVNVCGNAAAVFGQAVAGCKGGATVDNGGGKGNHSARPYAQRRHQNGHVFGFVTDGRSSVVGGNQVVSGVTAPINVCGNAVAVLGDAAAGCVGGADNTGQAGKGRNPFTVPRNKTAKADGGGLLPSLPLAPGDLGSKAGGLTSGKVGGLTGGKAAGIASGQTGGGLAEREAAKYYRSAQLPPVPAVGDPTDTFGLPELPLLPDVGGIAGGLPGGDQAKGLGGKGSGKGKGLGKGKGKGVLPGGKGKGKAAVPGHVRHAATDMPALVPVKNALQGVPVGDGLPSAGKLSADKLPVDGLPTEGLPTDDLPTGGLPSTDGLPGSGIADVGLPAADGLPLGKAGLMSAEQPGLTGMNNASLAALLLGGLFAASAAVSAFARRALRRVK
ncbi:chaplin family protein [Bailinhaonella thermotolerans]|uniref:DUF320 domain-containing protein n=1 Tax=Bailinhaonella thermotolerans TaxID=1070861 RepID=A0A3A4B1I0_9ACTN|nr:chaplin family protein [Bailinhaonella thermotolerans]RJL31887.1 DUF320 domain-containing protein [Bailinhaonella thermotolerans]